MRLSVPGLPSGRLARTTFRLSATAQFPARSARISPEACQPRAIAGPLVLPEIGAGLEQPAGQAGNPGLACRRLGTGGTKIHLHIKNGQRAAFDEKHLGAARRGPGLDRQPGARGRG